MKKYISVIVILTAILSGLAGCKSEQDLTPAQRLERQQKKEIQRIQDSLEIVGSQLALDSMDFVFETDRLLLKQGTTVNVTSTTNFISVHKGKCTVQIAPFLSPGPNGVGGFTLDGNVNSVRRSIDKHGTRTVQMNVQGAVLSSTIVIKLFANSTQAQATISPNFNALRISLQGRIVPFAGSIIVKGNSI